MQIATNTKRQVIDITEQVEECLAGSGLVNVFIKHTTAAITLTDLDPGTDEDLLDAFESMTPHRPWRHPHNPAHFPDHLWSALIGPGLTLPYHEGKLQLGSWQRLILVELDGPRSRLIELTAIKGV